MDLVGAKPETVLESWAPCPALAPFVREYGLRKVRLGGKQVYIPLPARSDCFLEFYLEDRYRVIDLASGDLHHAPRSVLVGPHTRRREDLLHSGTLQVFTIRFTSVGFRALFGIPARAIRDVAESADHVVGPSVRELEQRLAASNGLDRITVTEIFLLDRLYRGKRPLDGGVAGRLAYSLERRHGKADIAGIAALHGLSVRQVERVFEEHVGVTPKVFSRLVRLKRALHLSQAPGAPDWAGIAATAGYFDQSHLVREYRALTGETPAGFRILMTQAAPPARAPQQHVAFVQSNPGVASIAYGT